MMKKKKQELKVPKHLLNNNFTFKSDINNTMWYTPPMDDDEKWGEEAAGTFTKKNGNKVIVVPHDDKHHFVYDGYDSYVALKGDVKRNIQHWSGLKRDSYKYGKKEYHDALKNNKEIFEDIEPSSYVSTDELYQNTY